MDLSTVDAVEGELDGVRTAGWKTVVLDLREVSFIDSAGLNVVLRTNQLFAEHGIDFAIIEDPGPVRRLLDLSGVSQIFPASGTRVLASRQALLARPLRPVTAATVRPSATTWSPALGLNKE